MKLSFPYNKLLTDKATVGVVPPPADTDPGWGAPCGGNIFIGGGVNAAAAATEAVAIATCSAVMTRKLDN